jgi:hypothetical protein
LLAQSNESKLWLVEGTDETLQYLIQYSHEKSAQEMGNGSSLIDARAESTFHDFFPVQRDDPKMASGEVPDSSKWIFHS